MGYSQPPSRELPSPSKEVLLHVRYLPTTGAHIAQLLSSFFCCGEGTWKPEKLPALCRQCKGEGPLNTKITLDRESDRSSADLYTVRAAAPLQGRRDRDSPSQAAMDAAGQLQPP